MASFPVDDGFMYLDPPSTWSILYIYIYPHRLRSKLDKLYFFSSRHHFCWHPSPAAQKIPSPDMRGEERVLSRDFQDIVQGVTQGAIPLRKDFLIWL